LGEGNQLVCEAAGFYRPIGGKIIEEIMAGFGVLQRTMADEQQFRWLGPHKGVVQLALASVTNACWDLWAKIAWLCRCGNCCLASSPNRSLPRLTSLILKMNSQAPLALEILREHQSTRGLRKAF